ncbi:Uncharacterized protein FKW44_004034 [Caligus rogercresseyi]|uniref:Uncharacterized protein n=1 Tax=Caligus rogercresseyi TaxID=217165 RepID=A0A7T8HL28_CALRO|nr:Uncharacterized protein FKW44_004034 [Caligus rogercresseyi]
MKFKAKVESDPTISLNRLSKEFKRVQAHNPAGSKEDLGLQSFVRTHRQLLTAAAMEKRLDRCKLVEKKPCLIKIFFRRKDLHGGPSLQSQK